MKITYTYTAKEIEELVRSDMKTKVDIETLSKGEFSFQITAGQRDEYALLGATVVMDSDKEKKAKDALNQAYNKERVSMDPRR